MPIIYYVRHGLTDWNKAGRLQGRRDVPLSDTGRVQAMRCGEIIGDLLARNGGVGNCGFVSSPLGRARETMELIRERLGLDRMGYEVDERLAEIAFGEWEGLTYADVIARDKDIVARREGNKWLFRPPGGETYAEVAERVGQWAATLTSDVVVTAHGGTGRALIASLGIEPCEEATHHPIDHGLVYVFENKQVKRYG